MRCARRGLWRGAIASRESHAARATYFSQGNYAKAGIEFRNALQIAPKDTTAQLMVARVAEHLGQVRAAASLYQAVIDSFPGNIDARVGLGRLLVLGGQSEHAVQILNPGITQHPDDAGLLTWRAAAEMRLKDMTGALADADRTRYRWRRRMRTPFLCVLDSTSRAATSQQQSI